MGSGPGAVSHLFSEGDDYEDFHLRAELRINFRGGKGVDFGNSGIYFRASRTLAKLEFIRPATRRRFLPASRRHCCQGRSKPNGQPVRTQAPDQRIVPWC